MTEFVLKIVPLLLAFIVGLGAKKLKLLKKEDAPILLRFVLTVSIPAFAILAIYKVEMYASMLIIPIFAMGIVMAMYFISLSLKPVLKLPEPMFGSFLVGTRIMNSAFALPFFKAAFGDEGLARASLFDLGNSFMIFTFSYYNAIKYGKSEKKDKIEWKKFLRMMPLWAMVIAFVIKVFSLRIPRVGLDFLELIGAPTVP
ncbi:MAG: AEC family transporter, partial [Candidatus Cloacimonadaceae bacterium]